MPELPEVETTRRGIAPFVEGERILGWTLRETRLRWPVELPDALRGMQVSRVDRRAKYLLFRTAPGTLIVHLGMSGSLRVVPENTPAALHDHVDLELSGQWWLRYNDPRRFGCIRWQPDHNDGHVLLASLGVEPLSPDFDGAYLKRAAKGRSVAIKNLIMNGQVVVGVGNIYAQEALFLAGIRPTVAARRITAAACEALVEAIQFVLARSISVGGTTLRDFVNPDGNPGYFKQMLNVYGRQNEPCLRCGTPLKLARQAARSTVYCPKCQRPQGFRRLP